MKTLLAATAVATLLVGMMPATAGPWSRWHGPYAAQRFHPWEGGGRLALRRFDGFYGGGRPYGGYAGGGYGGYGGGGHQTATGGPSGGLPGGS